MSLVSGGKRKLAGQHPAPAEDYLAIWPATFHGSNSSTRDTG